ncbi:MAG: hypothetical protein Q9181_004732 [Wetmoreana brouardii]
MDRFGGVTQTEYLQQANDSLLTIVQIETRDALQNVEDIAKVPGVDVLFCGPYDLGNNIGHPILDGTMHDELKEAVAKIQRVAKENRKSSGIYATSGGQAQQYADQGFQMVSVATDAASLPASMQSALTTAEGSYAHSALKLAKEALRGWSCCKPRVLTFDEFLSIPPCTTGKHSTVDDTPAPEPASKLTEDAAPPRKPNAVTNGDPEIPAASRLPQAPQQTASTPPPPPPESESDDPSIAIPPNKTCRRRGCNTISSTDTGSSTRDGEECVYHPGQALFHEGSKGWTCCKRRVLEFDEFMKIEGCKRKKCHMFVGSGKKDGKEEALLTVRHDFYQTPTTVIASFFLKKIDKERAKIEFSSSTDILLDLPTADNKRYTTSVPLFGRIDTMKSTSKIMGTKLELTLVKHDGASWPTLRSDEQRTSEITQVGPAGRA